MQAFRKRDEGFTLVELMVVVLIIGILVAIAIPVFNAAKANAQKKSCYANQRTLEGAAQTYAADNDGTYPAAVADLAPDYVKAVPTCPAGGAEYAWATVSATVEPGTLVDCNATDHGHY